MESKMHYDTLLQKQTGQMQQELGVLELAEMQLVQQISVRIDQPGIQMEPFQPLFDNFLGKTSEMGTLFSMPQKAQVQIALL